MAYNYPQYNFCEFCGCSYLIEDGHKFSRAHIKKRQSMLLKFNEKVNLMKSLVMKPTICETGWQVKTKFWCLFCSKELNKHVHMLDATVAWGGFCEHIASLAHKNSVTSILQREGLEEEDCYSLQETLLTSFQVNAEQNIRQFLFLKMMQEKKASNAIAAAEEHQRRVRQLWQCTPRPAVPLKNNSVGSVKTGGRATSAAAYTMAAEGEGLVCLDFKSFPRTPDNIHSEATPPWFNSSDISPLERNMEIGPTKMDLDNYLKEEKKKDLPAYRVGADKSKRVGVLFGGVWSSSRRHHARKHHMIQVKRDVTKAFISSSNHYIASSPKTMLHKEPSTNSLPLSRLTSATPETKVSPNVSQMTRTKIKVASNLL